MPTQTHYINPHLLKPRRQKRAQRVMDALGRLGDMVRLRHSRERWSAGTSAFLSLDKGTRRAIVFVHGFGGTAVPTWLNFPGLLDGNPATSAYDFIFFEYDGLQTAADESANTLMSFLDEIFTNAARLVNPALEYQPFTERRPSRWAYEKVLIVAHSLGAVVTRRALVQAHEEKRTWLPQTRFMLFAPADSGCVIEELVCQALIGIPYVAGVPAAARLVFKLIALGDVKPGSQTLVDLKQLTQQNLNRGTSDYLLARKVLRARQDSVITNPVAFLPEENAAIAYVPAQDPPFGSDVPTGHVAVCKPTEAFREPIDNVLLVLSQL